MLDRFFVDFDFLIDLPRVVVKRDLAGLRERD